MFDIGFWELILIAVVALVVVGPERLPRLAYTAGKWLGKGRAALTTVKQEIDREIKAEQLKRVLEEQQKALNPLEEIIEETSDAVQDLKRGTEQAVRAAEGRTDNPASKPDTHDQTDRPGG